MEIVLRDHSKRALNASALFVWNGDRLALEYLKVRYQNAYLRKDAYDWSLSVELPIQSAISPAARSAARFTGSSPK